ncbi:hypothetical protein TEA_008422 [Camellia sinensis var. sinensis]|uniref:Pentatricopeptide repeat-containing protein n=1 Tax=Camellia sinensis var. sinensis TaxID=542762 RepID=A0A4S4EWA3_CAMSN|nr:hypothetical protein TEA_008422 [Camellia sinensis var. sinensis]
MGSRGFSVDSAIGNAYIIYYSLFGSLTEIEAAYGRLKRSRILIEKDGIRAMSFAYIKEKKFYRLGEFLRDVGLGRRNVGNLLWNLLLLSYAANFKMKTLQREFLRMVEAGFHPDLTTFNIRALAFSKMSLFWDLHLSLEHMKHEQVVPDLVTYSCIVDAYLDKRLGMNLDFALSKMNVHASPQFSHKLFPDQLCPFWSSQSSLFISIYRDLRAALFFRLRATFQLRGSGVVHLSDRFPACPILIHIENSFEKF